MIEKDKSFSEVDIFEFVPKDIGDARVNKFLEMLKSEIGKLDWFLFPMSHICAIQHQDGSFFIEWIFDKFGSRVVFEKDDKDSSWHEFQSGPDDDFYVNNHGESLSGDNYERVVKEIVRFTWDNLVNRYYTTQKKSCPLCGGLNIRMGWAYRYGKDRYMEEIKCLDCGCRVYDVSSSGVMRKWNKRFRYK